MNLAYSYGVNRIWIVNVGDIKPMEFPIEFFLDYAWNPEAPYQERPKMAIDIFLQVLETQIEVLFKAYQVIIKKPI